jgi:hypothetical protein
MADQLKLTGVLKLIEEPQKITDKLTKRTAVLTTAEKYPQDVAFEFINDAADLLDRYTAGMEATILFNVRGREYNGKFYTNLSGWKIESADAAPAQPAAQQPTSANRNPNLRAQPVAQPIGEDSDSLPF